MKSRDLVENAYKSIPFIATGQEWEKFKLSLLLVQVNGGGSKVQISSFYPTSDGFEILSSLLQTESYPFFLNSVTLLDLAAILFFHQIKTDFMKILNS